ncbi:SpoIIE family protein phosphatase [Marinobacter sp. CHS3-4]|uniref:SpoIIE family protein phosphatase n=1 Tax=Marinobacter sp. CHS3-4 TaxID=3045174 RepID=UPI0024B6002F|nr:SpoIIE family protein phosphatase [Marinobacter sp. CHS3-4]MDI9245910.1 SpoIIE family protein phosphatase [Marinobacter sp. CHS3-4]
MKVSADHVDASALRILIADDSDSDRLILKTLLKRLGHEVRAASDGREAVTVFPDYQPDIVLLDVLMPVMDGIDAARRIKEMAGEELVPVIFLTSLTDADALAHCLDAGGDDFLTKPYNKVIIQAKLGAFNRMRQMHRTLSRQRDLIQDRNRQLLEEQQLAKRVFDNIAHTGCLDADNIRYHISPLSIFNGDILFACPRPAGGMHILVGDFTGHGLPAAIGALPIAEIFYGMTTMGFSGSDLLREINDKLVRILPTGMFCCAALIQADFHLNQLRIWNGGLPDGVLIRRDGTKEFLESKYLPLGVLSSGRFDASMEVFHTSAGDMLLMMTDGVLEAENQNSEQYGGARLKQALDNASASEQLIDAVLTDVVAFCGHRKGRDDLTLVSLKMVVDAEFRQPAEQLPQSVLKGPTDWHCVYEVRDETLGKFSPLPLLLHICMEVPGLRRKSADIYTLLSELYNNALEHGVLKLSSDLKTSSDGFSYYYSERERRLGNVDGHFIRFSLAHRKTDAGGQLRIICEDSGDGFDHTTELESQATEAHYSGRGLMLMQKLGNSLRYSEYGSCAEIVYDWELAEPVPE